MREGWRKTPLAALTERRRDFTQVDGNHRYQIVGVQRSGLGLVHRPAVLGSSMKFTKLMRLEEGDLVFRTITAFEAPSTVVGVDSAGAFVTPQTFPVFRIKCDLALPEFIRILTTLGSFHEAMAERSVGSVLRRKTLSATAFQSIPIQLPPLPEQHRIVDLIGAVDDAIEAADEAAHAFLSQRTSTLRLILAGAHRFSGWQEADAAEWTTPPLGQVAKLHYGKPLREGERIEGAVPVVGSSGTFGWHNEPNVSTSESIVVGRKGTAGSVTWFSEPVWVSDTAFWAEPIDEMEMRFLYLALQDADLTNYIAQTGVPGLNRDRAYSAPIPIPPLFEQRDIVALMSQMDEATGGAADFATSLRSLRSDLITTLLSGEHEIPASYDARLEGAA
jgi:type I restriction enzyme S subunit